MPPVNINRFQLISHLRLKLCLCVQSIKYCTSSTQKVNVSGRNGKVVIYQEYTMKKNLNFLWVYVFMLQNLSNTTLNFSDIFCINDFNKFCALKPLLKRRKLHYIKKRHKNIENMIF